MLCKGHTSASSAVCIKLEVEKLQHDSFSILGKQRFWLKLRSAGVCVCLGEL